MAMSIHPKISGGWGILGGNSAAIALIAFFLGLRPYRRVLTYRASLSRRYSISARAGIQAGDDCRIFTKKAQKGVLDSVLVWNPCILILLREEFSRDSANYLCQAEDHQDALTVPNDLKASFYRSSHCPPIAES
jgi:hypothetical protein